MEHTTLHLSQPFFWHKFLYDIRIVPTKDPIQAPSHGMNLAGREKMSKSRATHQSQRHRDKYGADTLRLYNMFIGDFEKAGALVGQRRQGLQALLTAS
jgi:leucyl-tRNA synthetase